jgi:biopolymer transport protein ExbB/TolQ
MRPGRAVVLCVWCVWYVRLLLARQTLRECKQCSFLSLSNKHTRTHIQEHRHARTQTRTMVQRKRERERNRVRRHNRKVRPKTTYNQQEFLSRVQKQKHKNRQTRGQADSPSTTSATSWWPIWRSTSEDRQRPSRLGSGSWTATCASQVAGDVPVSCKQSK